MEVAELWRYPVKSMAGERISTAEVGQRGLPGDRRLAVFELAPHPQEKQLSARDVAGLLRFRATLNSGAVQVAGPAWDWLPWDDQQVRRRISQQCRRELELRPTPDGAFDDSPILLVHLATTAALSEELDGYVDPRRFRANLYLEGQGVAAHEERLLVGREIRCGAAVLEVTSACPRCSITTRDPDTWANWPQLLRHLVQSHDELVGVYCRVKLPGRISAGDRVELL
ncbi:MAG TPA: MOSC domain-containing protein [Candidatus Dormibacteraeota bacterium]|nr:MOSC domain-containing protein [Candidatus Dormibacteraeota bacterium]